jgi:hypothetical protein
VTEDQHVETWWNSVKDSDIWSGAITGNTWADLWEGAREDLRDIFRAAHNT